MKEFKKGDFVFNEFELKQIVRVERGQVLSVTCGMFNLSGSNLKCYPLNIRISSWNKAFRKISDSLHAIKHVNLNYPDIHRWLVCKWENACELILNEKYEELKSIEKDIYDFRDGMIAKENHGLGDYWMGIRVLRQTL